MTNVINVNFFRGPKQFELFPNESLNFNKYFWVDYDELNQRKVLEITSKLRVTHIIDTREIPVFRKPEFHYPELFQKFNQLHVLYYPVWESRNVEKKIIECNMELTSCMMSLSKISVMLIHNAMSEISGQRDLIENYFPNTATLKEVSIR